ncbi:hypothetical protein [Gordonia sp. (in: high G+C Gram-positive bacteria)]|uniref:hypothetical protein n=1 Tax=Gordonia sp. (in: high G+C Gram-positive bacteria) TaxID=84139 RepID=UPI003C730E40
MPPPTGTKAKPTGDDNVLLIASKLFVNDDREAGVPVVAVLDEGPACGVPEVSVTTTVVTVFSASDDPHATTDPPHAIAVAKATADRTIVRFTEELPPLVSSPANCF